MILEEIHFVLLQPSTSVSNQVNQHSQLLPVNLKMVNTVESTVLLSIATMPMLWMVLFAHTATRHEVFINDIFLLGLDFLYYHVT